MYIEEQWVEVRNRNTDDETRLFCGSSDIYEPFTDNIGKLFKSLQREYGKCVSKVYINDPEDKNKAIAIGWVFEKLQKYDDYNEYYLQETWVKLHKSKPVTSVKYDYFTLN